MLFTVESSKFSLQKNTNIRSKILTWTSLRRDRQNQKDKNFINAEVPRYSHTSLRGRQRTQRIIKCIKQTCSRTEAADTSGSIFINLPSFPFRQLPEDLRGSRFECKTWDSDLTPMALIR